MNNRSKCSHIHFKSRKKLAKLLSISLSLGISLQPDSYPLMTCTRRGRVATKILTPSLWSGSPVIPGDGCVGWSWQLKVWMGFSTEKPRSCFGLKLLLLEKITRFFGNTPDTKTETVEIHRLHQFHLVEMASVLMGVLKVSLEIMTITIRLSIMTIMIRTIVTIIKIIIRIITIVAIIIVTSYQWFLIDFRFLVGWKKGLAMGLM